MYRTIVVPLDGSSFGEYALPLALSLARCACARLILIHVRDSTLSPEGELLTEQTLASPYLDTLAAYLGERWEVQLSTTVIRGQVEVALIEWIDAYEVDLIVMSTHGHSMLKEALLGGVASALIRHAHVPVLLVRPHEASVDLLETVRNQPCAHLLVPLDGSPSAEQIFGPAIALARLADAELTLLSVIQPAHLASLPAASTAHRIAEHLAAQRVEGEQYLEQHASRLRAEGLHVHTQLAVGSAPETILAVATEQAVDMIAMTTHAQGGLSRLLLGSVAEAVIRHAGVPVLVSHPLASATDAPGGSHEA